MKSWPIILLILLLACQHQADPRNENYPLNNSLFEKGAVIGTISDKRLLEASGLQYSYQNPGHLWTHNDSQGQPSIYLIDTTGQIQLTVYLKGAMNYDWEDITSDGEHLYIAEIGDNRAERDHVKIYMLEEPISGEKDSIAVDNWLEMKLTYANGARDAESLMYDKVKDELVVVTKREESCFIYSFTFIPGAEMEISPKGQLDLRMFTAGDVDQIGNMIIKNYDALFYWENSEHAVIQQFTKGPDGRIPYQVEPQGEALTFAPDGSFYTLSEYNANTEQYLYVYRRKPAISQTDYN